MRLFAAMLTRCIVCRQDCYIGVGRGRGFDGVGDLVEPDSDSEPDSESDADSVEELIPQPPDVSPPPPPPPPPLLLGGGPVYGAPIMVNPGRYCRTALLRSPREEVFYQALV